MGVSGSNTRLSLGGIKFSVMADSDFSEVPEILNEGIATSGKNIHKITKQVATVSGVTVDASNPIAYQQLLNLNKEVDSISISYTTADGSALSGYGWINLETRTTQEATATLSLTPDTIFELIPA